MVYTQDEIATDIIREGQTARNGGPAELQHPPISPRGIQIALSTAWVESKDTVYANPNVPESQQYPHDAEGTDHASDGEFQQQYMWWGTVSEEMDPFLSAAMFYSHLAKLNYNDLNTSPGTFAQDVQQSAYPDRYDQEFSLAVAQYNRLAKGDIPALAPGLAPAYYEQPEWSPNHQSRNGAQPNLWIIHTEEGAGDAASLANFLDQASSQVSYHYTIDNNVNVDDIVDTDFASWSVLDENNYSINLCFAGSFASWSRQQWLDDMGNAIDVAAYLCVQDCIKYGIATTVIAPPYSLDPPGITDHKYVTEHLGIGTHTDVGDNFPWDVFSQAIAKYATGGTAMDNTQLQSYSAYRASDDKIGTATDFILYTNRDGHMMYVEHHALAGIPWAVDEVTRLASGDETMPGVWSWILAPDGSKVKDQWAIDNANAVLAKIPAAARKASAARLAKVAK